jgi:hypothetical protein
MIAGWLQQHLEDRGLWDADGTTRVARGRRCRTCREYTLAGLDANRCALPVAVDVDPLSPRGEVAAVLSGRTTYSLRLLADQLELDRRGAFEIRSGRTERLDVLPRHVCGLPSLGLVPGLGAPSRLGFRSAALMPVDPPF